MKALQPFPSIALGAFSEDLVTSRRVVIFGNALSGLAETLVERGARLVHVYDENPARVAEAAARSTLTQVSFAPLGPGGIAARDGAFDVGFIDEITQFATASTVITRLRRALTARGVALVSTVNPDKKLMYSVAPESANALGLTLASADKPLSYYDLYDLVTSEFDEVKMVGQTPFVGYALADFSPETDVEFSIDTALVPGGAEEPEFFIAICSHFPVTTESFCVVQMTAESLLGPHLSALSVARTSVSATKATVANEIRPDAQRLQNQIAETQRLLTSEREARTKAEQLLSNVNAELQHRDAWVAELEKRAATADERADAAEAAVDRLEARAKQHAARSEDAAAAQSRQAELSRQLTSLTQVRRSLESDLTRANESLVGAQSALSAIETERDGLRAQGKVTQAALAKAQAQSAAVTQLEAQLTTVETQHATTRADLQVILADLERAERHLLAQSKEVQRLQTELADTERFAALLIAQREAQRSRVSDDHLGNQGRACTGGGPTDTAGLAASVDVAPLIVPVVADDEAVEVGAGLPVPPTAFDTLAASSAPAFNAEHEATMQGLRWTIEELEQRLEATSQEEVLLARLHAAQQQLQRQAVLLRQYENKGSDTAPNDL